MNEKIYNKLNSLERRIQKLEERSETGLERLERIWGKAHAELLKVSNREKKELEKIKKRIGVNEKHLYYNKKSKKYQIKPGCECECKLKDLIWNFHMTEEILKRTSW